MFSIITLMYPYVSPSGLGHFTDHGSHSRERRRRYTASWQVSSSCHWFSPGRKNGTDRYLPYPLLKYDIGWDPISKMNTARMHIIDAESIFRPAIMIPCNDRSANFEAKLKISTRANSTDCTSAMRMWGIPYKILVRSGYDITFPSADAADDNNLFLHDDNINLIRGQTTQTRRR